MKKLLYKYDLKTSYSILFKKYPKCCILQFLKFSKPYLTNEDFDIYEYNNYFHENYNYIEKPRRKIKAFTKTEEIKRILYNLQREKTKNTNLEKYGTEEYFQTDEFKKKYKDTMMEKYGVDHNMRHPILKNKIKHTLLEKYGNENYNNIEKIKQTQIEKYGGMGYEVPEFLEKCKNTMIERYDDENYNVKKSQETMLKRYGVKYGFQIPGVIKKTQESFFNNLNYNFKELLNNKDFILNNFIDKFGFFEADKFKEFFNCSRSRLDKTKKELNIDNRNKKKFNLKQNQFFENIGSNKKIINFRGFGPEIDLYLPEIKLGIEYNGLVWHSQGYSDSSMINRPNPDLGHFEKMNFYLRKGIQIFNIFEDEKPELWLSMIHNKLGLNKRIFARKCIIKELESNEIKEFLNENHIQGYIPSRINLGLFYNFENSEEVENSSDIENSLNMKNISCQEDSSLNENSSNNLKLVQVMTFSKSRYTRDIEYELIRLCGLKGYSIIGGASKLLKYFETKYKPKSIVSFANRRFSNGDIYRKLGFDFVENTNPNYFYFKRNENILYSRVQFQKHKLKDKLEIFDPNLSETENMLRNGYRRIFDCGNMKFIKKY